MITKETKAIAKLLSQKFKDEKQLMSIKRKIAREFKLEIFTNAKILAYISQKKLKLDYDILRLLRKRAVRTMSGIAPVAVLTKPYPCPGKCAYCPTEKNVPQSYLSNEPAVMRAIRCHYDPYVQVQDRLRALLANGHNPEKIELIVIGGTWSCLPTGYQEKYITECFRAANDFPTNRKKVSKILNLSKEQKRNEKAKYRIIGLTLETRPDYITEKELWHMRELGCTRVELGVQAINDNILKKNKRGHGVKEIAEATKLLKDFGFKVTYHIMPGLPASTPTRDLAMFKQLFADERFQPDQIKFYPTVVTKGSLLHRWWKQGKYKPYSNQTLEKLIMDCKQAVPPYVRIIRLIRDIPAESIEAGNIVTNLRQVMKDRGVSCRCIRCREAGSKPIPSDLKLFQYSYPASGGEEYFLSYESADGDTLYGFARLRLGEKAFVRELHIYGELVPVGGQAKKVQHSGLGKKLLHLAENIAKKKGYSTIQVISGVGVRGYYLKSGYKLEKTYMKKNL